jgi:ADP-ribose pyrophosphatase YjhB (NUDIX family)
VTTSPPAPPAPPAHITRVAAYSLCFDGDGRLLLVRVAESVPDEGRWMLPGGGLEFGERPEDGALRELEEETGLVGEIDGLLGVVSRAVERSRSFPGRSLHLIGLIYRAHVVSGSLRDEVGGTTDACCWFSPEELATLPLVGIVDRALELAGLAPGHRWNA